MAGDWIKMTTSLHENPHVVEMAEILEIDELHVIGMLWRVWAWADEQTTDHTGINTTERRLNKMVVCDGFCDALRQVGWLEGEDKNLSFPNFNEHNGSTAKNRALGRNRNQKYRNSKGCDGGNNVEEIPCDASRVTPSITPVTQVESLEKRREEKNTIGDNEAYSGKPPLPKSSDEVKSFLVAEVSSGRVSLLPTQIDQASLLFFNDMESSGWIDAKSRPVNNWQAAVRAFAMRFATNQKPLSVNKPKSRRDDLWQQQP